MDFFTWAILYVAATMQALEAALRTYPELSARAPAFVKGKVWAFLPFALLSLVGLIWLAQALAPNVSQPLVRNEIESRTANSTPAVVASAPSETTAATPEAEPTSAPTERAANREILHITPKYLVSLVANDTSVQGQRLVQGFIGKWMTITGPVDDVSEDDDTASVMFVYLPDKKNGPYMYFVSMSFNSDWKDRIVVLSKGTRILVLGQIAGIDAHSVTLENCEFTPAP